LGALQADVEGELGALEGPGEAELREALSNFVNLIEQYFYSLSERRRHAKMNRPGFHGGRLV
jgi:hypothetical protein